MSKAADAVADNQITVGIDGMVYPCSRLMRQGNRGVMYKGNRPGFSGIKFQPAQGIRGLEETLDPPLLDGPGDFADIRIGGQ